MMTNRRPLRAKIRRAQRRRLHRERRPQLRPTDAEARMEVAQQKILGVVRGKRRREGVALRPLATEGLQGRFGDALTEIGRVGAVARDASDGELAAWDKHTRGHTLWRVGEIERAVPLLQEASEAYRSIPSTVNLVFALADLAECRRREGRYEEAAALLAESRALIKERGFRGFAVWLTPVAEADLQLELAERSSGADRREALRAARVACRRAAAAARVAREASPAALRVRGTHDWLSGRRQRAEDRWQASTAEAARLGARFELALTEQEARRRLEQPGRYEHGEELLRAMRADALRATRGAR